MNARIERIVAEYRAAIGRRLGELEAVRLPRQLPPPHTPPLPEREQEPEGDEPYYRPKSWLI
ncbi:hypothetical protein F8M49_03705 [Rhodococcus zopfii]|uniref:Uncharacterized protein n=1 Tax=Rhodococcus zopfii TaxID=43772 RepID=A0ABU3WL99_9NOCA|nr:hypothetical protein [Rhodococcus zopfii]MDV2474759.1 hypothetical protein [Rhodococcus zopfii]